MESVEKTQGSLIEANSLTKGKRPFWIVLLLGGILFFPFLGASGLWDCWETHYAEVAREMVESGNWLDPTWEHSPGQSLHRKYFFSKPPLTMWLMAVPMKIFGIHREDGGIVSYAEWYLRIPFALCALLGLFGVFLIAKHFFGPKVGLLAAVILATCSQYVFIARQAMTDMPILGLSTMGMACLVIGGFDREQVRPKLLYLGYALLALAIFAKGLLAIVLPGLTFLTYFIISGDWKRLARMHVFGGALLTICIAAPWFVYLSIKSAFSKPPLLDSDGNTYFYRFFLHDHLYRLGSGVHGERGTFAYFIKQMGIGAHPWFPFMVWGGLRTALRLDQKTELNRQERVEMLVFIWALAGFSFYAFSITKFNHYILPVLVPCSMLAALWLDRFSRGEENPGRILIPLVLLLALCMISRDIGLMPKTLIDLFTYKYDRIFPKEEAIVGQVGYAIVFGLVCLFCIMTFFFFKDRFAFWVIRALTISALVAACWSGWYFFNAMGPHWSQKHLFDTYFALRRGDEPIGAYLMNWRGETFYSRNQVVQLKKDEPLRNWLAQHKSKRKFILVEQYRLSKLQAQLSLAEKRNLRILDRTCNKFYLVSVYHEPFLPTP